MEDFRRYPEDLGQAEETFRGGIEEETPEDKVWPITRLYYKIGGYFKISFKEFMETPWPVIKQLSLLLDEKEGDMNQFIGYDEAAMFKNLKRMFASKND